jgi:hypothetical protein
MPKRKPQDVSTEEHLIINVDTEEHHTEETKSTIPVLNSDKQDVSEQETLVSEEVSEAPAPKSLTVTKELLERMRTGEFRPIAAYDVLDLPADVLEGEKQRNFLLMLMIQSVKVNGHLIAPEWVSQAPVVSSRRTELAEDGKLHVFQTKK